MPLVVRKTKYTMVFPLVKRIWENFLFFDRNIGRTGTGIREILPVKTSSALSFCGKILTDNIPYFQTKTQNSYGKKRFFDLKKNDRVVYYQLI